MADQQQNPRPVNPDDQSASCLIVSNSGQNFAIYARDEHGGTAGRLFLSVDEMQAIIAAFNKVCADQHLIGE